MVSYLNVCKVAVDKEECVIGALVQNKPTTP
jgi:hypothetical protein